MNLKRFKSVSLFFSSSALFMSLSHGQQELNLNKFDNLLSVAIDANNKELFKRVLNSAHAKHIINAPETEGGITPLHVAAEKGRAEMTQELLDRGALVDKSDETGATPLSKAIENGHYDVARKILSKKPLDFNAYNSGYNVLDILAQKIADTKDKPFESDEAKLFVELVHAGANYGESYYDPQVDKRIYPLDFINRKISPTRNDYKQFLANLQSAYMAYKSESGVVDENSSAPSTKPAEH